ncbi:MAG: DUF4065 domain-containing protein [Candidatus Omnitrophica bacterium]|nr:DUF4065 domain-containing protein [Candidatus Omnitrophota bacterium]
MKKYCPACDDLCKVLMKEVEETYQVKGEGISVLANVCFCEECDEKVFDVHADSSNLQKVYDVYREKHHLLNPQEIMQIREGYGLSQRALARLLDWGEITINRYEKGSLQDAAHNEVLVFIKDPRNMKTLFEQNRSLLTQNEQDKLQQRINGYLNGEPINKLTSFIEGLFERDVDEFTGFVRFSLEKFLAMVGYILKKSEGEFPTKLNKLLWYSDFLFFKEYSKSITGCKYVPMKYGPVPEQYNLFYQIAQNDNLILEEEIIFNESQSGTRYSIVDDPKLALFTKDEIKIIDFVVDYFKNVNCKKIADISHDEKGYIETSLNEPISYGFASNLSISLK